jgi:hypothetical protein
MVAMLSSTKAALPADLLVAGRASLDVKPAESPHHPLFAKKPSLVRRASRALVRYLIAICVGIGGTLAWQSYGEAGKQLAANWAAQHGWSLAWLPFWEPAKETSPVMAAGPQPAVPPSASNAQTAAAAQSAPETVGETRPTSAALDLERLDALTTSLDAIRERVEQLAAGQEQMASDIAKLKTSDQEIRQKISAALRPPPTPANKPQPASAPPSRPPMALH